MKIATTILDFANEELSEFSDCLFSRQFLSFVEQEHYGRARPYYFHEREQTGLSAFAAAYVYEEAIPFTFRMEDFLLAQPTAHLFGPGHPYLVVNVPIRLRSRILSHGNDAAIGVMLDEILAWAGNENLFGVVFPFVLGSDVVLRHALESRGFAGAFYEGDFYLPIDGLDFEGFLGSLPSEPRKQLRNDMNRMARSDIEITRLSQVAEHAEELAELHHTLLERYGRPDEFRATSFANFAKSVSDHRIFVARSDQVLAGFSMSFYGHGVYHLLRYGKRDDADADARLYGNLVFVESIRQALGLGCSRVHFGKASHRAKSLRGCHYEEGIVYALYLNDHGQDALAANFSILDEANRSAFQAKCRGERIA